MKIYRYFGLVIFICSCLAAALSCAPAEVAKEPAASITTSSYQHVDMCRNCHQRAYEQFSTSMHSKSSTNPRFKAMYLRKTAHRIDESTEMAEEARLCLACHHPVAYMTSTEPLQTEEDFAGYLIADGTCDFCHTINGFKGKEPGNGNYISEPGSKKYGPHPAKGNWHHIYSPVQQSSRFCGTCHNYTNRYGLRTKSTYDEWKETVYFRKRITCQDCHMNSEGFISDTVPVFEKGKAAVETYILKPPHREELHTHRFPGAYTEHQLSGTVTLDIGSKDSVKAGGDAVVVVTVDSKRSGHKLPTGSTALRLLWLEVELAGGGKTIHLDAESRSGPFDVSGGGIWDADILGDSIPPRNRVYRQIFLDSNGNQTMYCTEAVEMVFDNRLDAAKTRMETYSLKAPGVKAEYTITATLNYLAYPKAFARELEIDEAKPIVVARETKKLRVR